MNVTKALSTLSVAAALAAAFPAQAQPLARHHSHTVTRAAPARHVTVVQRPVVVQRTVVVQRPVVIQRPVAVARPVYVARPAYAGSYGYWNYHGNYYRTSWNYYRSYWNYYYWTYWNRRGFWY
jgi:hypothetical protein